MIILAVAGLLVTVAAGILSMVVGLGMRIFVMTVSGVLVILTLFWLME